MYLREYVLPCLCPLGCAEVFLASLLQPPLDACTVWTGYSLWPAAPLTNCVLSAERLEHKGENVMLIKVSILVIKKNVFSKLYRLVFGQLNQKAKIYKDGLIWGHLKWHSSLAFEITASRWFMLMLSDLLPHRWSFWMPQPAPPHCPDLREPALASQSPDTERHKNKE